jgi:hypothetical protein
MSDKGGEHTRASIHRWHFSGKLSGVKMYRIRNQNANEITNKPLRR